MNVYIISRKIRGNLLFLSQFDGGWLSLNMMMLVIEYNDIFGFQKCENMYKTTLLRASSVVTIRRNLVSLKASCTSAHPNPYHSTRSIWTIWVHLGPFVRSRRGNAHVWAISDAFSKFLIVKPIKSTKTQPVILMLNEISYFGLPKVIVTDRGTVFTSKAFELYCERNENRHVKTAVRTPRANGQVERANDIILSYLRTAVETKGDWDLALRDLQWAVNSQRNATSGFSPNELVFDFA